MHELAAAWPPPPKAPLIWVVSNPPQLRRLIFSCVSPGATSCTSFANDHRCAVRMAALTFACCGLSPHTAEGWTGRCGRSSVHRQLNTVTMSNKVAMLMWPSLSASFMCNRHSPPSALTWPGAKLSGIRQACMHADHAATLVPQVSEPGLKRSTGQGGSTPGHMQRCPQEHVRPLCWLLLDGCPAHCVP